MKSKFGVRTKITAASAIVTVNLLSLFGALGYNAVVESTNDAQRDLLNERLDVLEDQLESTDSPLIVTSQVGSTLLVVREGNSVPPSFAGTLRVVRPHPDPEIDSIVGIVDMSRINATFSTIRVALWVSVAVIGLLIGGVAWLVVDRALSPVRRLTSEAEANMQTGSLDAVSVHEGSDDISKLANTFNSMLTRLRDADLERRQFVSDASHELRTPLMVLSAEAEYVIDHPSKSSSTTSAVDLATVVSTQTHRLTNLVDGLLDLATLDEEQPQPLEVTTVGHVIDACDAAPLTSELSAEDRGTFVPDISKSLSNIVANARRHAGQRVEVAVYVDERSVRFTVDDDGLGIPADERERIFNRFYRPDGHRNRTEGGAGLGLAIADAEVRQADGSITIDDSALGGARFIVVVPIHDERN